MRRRLIDFLDFCYESVCSRTGSSATMDTILEAHNVSFDDSDPQEGMYVSMSNEDIQLSIQEIVNKLAYKFPELKYLAIDQGFVRQQIGDKEWLEGFQAGCAYAHKDLPEYRD